ncbi:MAG TPA: hypothetical protein VGE01_00155 [Fimbriimonas sp.]
MDQNDHLPVPDGINLRDYFAGIALQSLLADYLLEAGGEGEEGYGLLNLGRQAYLVSDAMLIARDMPDLGDDSEEEDQD